MGKQLFPGLKHTLKHRISNQHTVPSLLPESDIFSGMPEVLASGYLVGLVEWACMEAMQSFLESGEGSVGTRFEMFHTSPTPAGRLVTVSVRCMEVEGKRTLWEFEAHDEKGPISHGKHERFTVNWEKFRKKLEE